MQEVFSKFAALFSSPVYQGMDLQLQPGTIERVLGRRETGPIVLQISAVKGEIRGTESLKIQATVSDGKDSCIAIFTKDAAQAIKGEALRQYSVLETERYLVEEKSGRMYIRIAHVKDFTDGPAAAKETTLKRVHEEPAPADAEEASETEEFTPVAEVSLYKKLRALRVRVLERPPVRSWSNSKGTGKLFSVLLCDESGRIRLTGFNEQVDVFYSLLRPGKVYRVADVGVRQSNKNFSTDTESDYDLCVRRDTKISECPGGSSSIPQIEFSFSSIAALEAAEAGSRHDVAGVVLEALASSTVVVRSTGKEACRRDIRIADRSERSVWVSLWGDSVEAVTEHNVGDVVALKGCYVRIFGTTTLVARHDTALYINLDISEVRQLHGWHSSGGAVVRDIGSSTGRPSLSEPERKSLEEMQQETGGVFQARCVVSGFHYDSPCTYMACAGERCGKKLVETADGYYCEKCNETRDGFLRKYILKTVLADSTAQLHTVLFSNTAEKLLGLSAEAAEEIFQQGGEEYRQLLKPLLHQDVLVQISCRTETYMDAAVWKGSVQSLVCLDYERETELALALLSETPQ